LISTFASSSLKDFWLADHAEGKQYNLGRDALWSWLLQGLSLILQSSTHVNENPWLAFEGSSDFETGDNNFGIQFHTL
jgi:hypothetical protein